MFGNTNIKSMINDNEWENCEIQFEKIKTLYYNYGIKIYPGMNPNKITKYNIYNYILMDIIPSISCVLTEPIIGIISDFITYYDLNDWNDIRFNYKINSSMIVVYNVTPNPIKIDEFSSIIKDDNNNSLYLSPVMCYISNNIQSVNIRKIFV